MPIHWQIMDRGRRLTDGVRNQIETCVVDAVEIVEQKCPDLDADLSIIATDIYTDPRWYRSGKAFGPGYAQIELNPDHPRFKPDWEDEAAPLVIHELHHCLRWAEKAAEWTIGEVIVLEGLAMLAEETSGKHALFYGKPPRSQVLDRLCKKAFVHSGSAEGEDTSWFRAMEIEGEKLEAPVNYHIGKAMMEVSLDAMGLDAFQAAKVPTATLLNAWKASV
ncbi:MAG: DUF2268 domain-containing putative Zn-dependent protease [Pseudomonadota bacterium]